MKRLILILIPVALLTGCVTVKVVDEKKADKVAKDLRLSMTSVARAVNKITKDVEWNKGKIKDLEKEILKMTVSTNAPAKR